MFQGAVAEGAVGEKPAISVVVPMYDEQECVFPLYGKIRDTCDALGKSYEVIFVDDGSRDGTFGALEEIHMQDARVKVLRFRKNYGQTAAMAAGFEYAKGDMIIAMDGDLHLELPVLDCKMIRPISPGSSANWKKAMT